jgi:hypothetical protein
LDLELSGNRFKKGIDFAVPITAAKALAGEAGTAFLAQQQERTRSLR